MIIGYYRVNKNIKKIITSIMIKLNVMKTYN